MANNKQSRVILTLPTEVAVLLESVREVEPVHDYDFELGGPSPYQKTDESGTPMWKTGVLVGMGYSGDAEVVECRFACPTKPVREKVFGRIHRLVVPGASESTSTGVSGGSMGHRDTGVTSTPIKRSNPVSKGA